MAQYIDKDALVAKIDNLKHKIDDRYSYSNGWKDTLRMLEAELNTLEVKEVDIEDEKCKDLRDGGICNFASTKLGRIMLCENISCSRRNKTQKGE